MSTYSGYGAGAFGALGGVISFEWVPEPYVIAGKLVALAGYLENFTPPLEASRQIARADMQMHFDTESSPEGDPWAELDPDYAKKRGSAHPILQLSGDMHDAAVSEGAFPIDGHDLWIDTSSYPPYSYYHEFGSGEDNVGFARDYRERIRGGFIEEGGARDGTGIGRGKALPKRSFIGISFDAEMMIIEAFDLWFQGAIAGFHSSKGGTTQVRTKSGRFGPKITPPE